MIKRLLATTNPLHGTITGPSTRFLVTNSDSTGAAAPIEEFFSTLIGFFTILGGIFFLVYFISAAMNWIAAGNDKSKVEGAKTQMVNAAIGLSAIVMAQFIIGIVGNVLGLQILDPAAMLQRLL